jgi:hypothetical protein
MPKPPRLSLLISLLAFLLAACDLPAPFATASPEPTRPAPSATPSLPPSQTPTPTSTGTVTPTPTPENDLHPIFSQNLDGTYMGIQINSRLITDQSANDEASRISLEKPEAGAVMAEFWVKTAYKVWLQKGGQDGSGPDEGVNAGIESFWRLWAQAQKTGAQADWEKVQITLWANDLATQDYRQTPLVFWLGYMGGEAPPPGVIAVRELDIAVVTASNQNVTPWGVYGAGMGTNYLNDAMLMYICKFEKKFNKYSDLDVSALIADTPKWWLGNDGRPFATLNASYSTDFINILKKGGFKVVPPLGFVTASATPRATAKP